ncbi:calphotin-like [Varroa jacobsoni]|uniref:calphotin-like n=1 Tax=Varroa jacobsoni TaxID=62625 RepID=UPI000BF73A42|nr:calphotin-like [Varroa jacobsoni]
MFHREFFVPLVTAGIFLVVSVFITSVRAKELVTGGYRLSLAERRALASAGIGHTYGTPYAASALIPIATGSRIAPKVGLHPVNAAAPITLSPKVVAKSVLYETRVYHAPVASYAHVPAPAAYGPIESPAVASVPVLAAHVAVPATGSNPVFTASAIASMAAPFAAANVPVTAGPVIAKGFAYDSHAAHVPTIGPVAATGVPAEPAKLAVHSSY